MQVSVYSYGLPIVKERPWTYVIGECTEHVTWNDFCGCLNSHKAPLFFYCALTGLRWAGRWYPVFLCTTQESVTWYLMTVGGLFGNCQSNLIKPHPHNQDCVDEFWSSKLFIKFKLKGFCDWLLLLYVIMEWWNLSTIFLTVKFCCQNSSVTGNKL